MALKDRPVLEANGTGIDIGARETFVAVTGTKTGAVASKDWTNQGGVSSRVTFERSSAKCCAFTEPPSSR